VRSLPLVAALSIAFILGCAGATPEDTGTGEPGDTHTGRGGTGSHDVDDDGDGFTENEGDCDDSSRSVNPDAADECDDGLDNDCAGGDEPCHSASSIARLSWIGDLTYDGSSVVVNYGLGALVLHSNKQVCWITAIHSGSGAAPEGCPDCAYAFATEVTGDSSGGDYCDAFTSDTIFATESASDFWFGSSAVKAWGWADSYTYTYSGTDYELTETVFMYYDDGASTRQWLLRHYNFPAGGVYNVEGDKYSASWAVLLPGDYYYYFYY
jgi:hypothetical protein